MDSKIWIHNPVSNDQLEGTIEAPFPLQYGFHVHSEDGKFSPVLGYYLLAETRKRIEWVPVDVHVSFEDRSGSTGITLRTESNLGKFDYVASNVNIFIPLKGVESLGITEQRPDNLNSHVKYDRRRGGIHWSLGVLSGWAKHAVILSVFGASLEMPRAITIESEVKCTKFHASLYHKKAQMKLDHLETYSSSLCYDLVIKR